MRSSAITAAICRRACGDLPAGVRRFCHEHPATSNLCDVAHKAATRLKSRLEGDERWTKFCTRASQTKLQAQQTEWAFLVPPAQPSKARYMNLEPLLNWATRTLRVLDEQPAATLRHGPPALRDELVAFVTAESAAARPGERLPGGSEILESAPGQLKSLEGDHQQGGFTGLLLSLRAWVGRLDATTIGTALHATPWKLVPQWLAKHFGQTLNSKRRETYA